MAESQPFIEFDQICRNWTGLIDWAKTGAWGFWVPPWHISWHCGEIVIAMLDSSFVAKIQNYNCMLHTPRSGCIRAVLIALVHETIHQCYPDELLMYFSHLQCHILPHCCINILCSSKFAGRWLHVECGSCIFIYSCDLWVSECIISIMCCLCCLYCLQSLHLVFLQALLGERYVITVEGKLRCRFITLMTC